VTTIVLGAHGPLGLAMVRQLLADGRHVVACVQAPHRIPPALDDLRDEFPVLLQRVAWRAGDTPSLPQAERAIIVELPIPPAQTDEADDPASDLAALTAENVITESRNVLAPTLAALQLVMRVKPSRALIQASWLGSVHEKIRGGSYALSAAYASHLMLVRTAALDLQRAGIATVIGNAGRFRLDMSGPGFHADVEDVSRGLLAALDSGNASDEPTFRDWRGAVRPW
jgi:NAD(P)-dependent dehydrogenase (short-subunit alcohol dehydrogenase family)